MRPKFISAAIRLALPFAVCMVLNPVDGKRGNMSDVPMDNLRGLSSQIHERLSFLSG